MTLKYRREILVLHETPEQTLRRWQVLLNKMFEQLEPAMQMTYDGTRLIVDTTDPVQILTLTTST